MRRALAASTALGLLLVTAPAAFADPAAQNPLDGARAAAQRLSFVGVVEVTWKDRGYRTEQLAVRAAAGSLEVQGATTVMAASGGERMVRRPGGDWDLLWSASQASAARPDLAAKYDFVPVPQAPAVTVASRPARLVEVREGAVLRERLFLDTATGLLLRREQLDRSGNEARTVAFSALQLDPPAPVPQLPAHPVDHSPRPVVVGGSLPAPAVLPGGYQRVGAYRERGAVQVLYSDGLYDLSIFEQEGGLRDRDVPPSGRRIRVGRSHGWVYGWPGGRVLLWPAGHTLYSLVSDAPADQLVAAAAALPAPGGSSSMVTRLRRACLALLEPLAP